VRKEERREKGHKLVNQNIDKAYGEPSRRWKCGSDMV
jgi:hypothetical protein